MTVRTRSWTRRPLARRSAFRWGGACPSRRRVQDRQPRTARVRGSEHRSRFHRSSGHCGRAPLRAVAGKGRQCTASTSGSSETPPPPAPAPPTMTKAKATTSVPALPMTDWIPIAASATAAVTRAKQGSSPQAALDGTSAMARAATAVIAATTTENPRTTDTRRQAVAVRA